MAATVFSRLYGKAYSLSLHFLVGFHVDVGVELQRGDLVARKLSTTKAVSKMPYTRTGHPTDAYLKPLYSLDSCVILPPCSSTAFLALQESAIRIVVFSSGSYFSSSFASDPSLSVT